MIRYQFIQNILIGVRQWVNKKLEDSSIVISAHINKLTEDVSAITETISVIPEIERGVEDIDAVVSRVLVEHQNMIEGIGEDISDIDEVISETLVDHENRIEELSAKTYNIKEVIVPDDGSALTITLSANTLYTFTTRESDLTILLETPAIGFFNEYHFIIEIGANVPNIDWPTGLTWYGDGTEPSLSANKSYEVDILNNVALYIEI